MSAKPVILAVDDDNEVLGAVERDLKQRYRQNYRVVSARSSAQAMEVAEELRRRGTPVALFLADQRMPETTGTEFLARVRKVHPDAKRALLTAYADSAAAIDAINSVGLDYYLMKPWDPPEDRLYPVIDDLLADWSAKARPSFEGVRVIGSRWSPQSYATRDFLSRNQIPYQWIDIDQDEPMRELALSANGGDPSKLPVVLLPDGTALTQPSTADLGEKCGLQTLPKQPYYDLAIVGAGPAGLACAVYGASEGLKVVLIEQNAPGGQAGTTSMIENYLGFPSGVTGAELARRATDAGKALRRRDSGRSLRGGPQTSRTVQGPASGERPGSGVSCARALVGHVRARARSAGSRSSAWQGRVLRRRAVRSQRCIETSTCSCWAAPTPPARARCSSHATRSR